MSVRGDFKYRSKFIQIHFSNYLGSCYRVGVPVPAFLWEHTTFSRRGFLTGSVFTDCAEEISPTGGSDKMHGASRAFFAEMMCLQPYNKISPIISVFYLIYI